MPKTLPKTLTVLMGAAGATMLAAVPAHAGDGKTILRNGAIGAAGGAVVGAVVPGLSVGEGALIGGAGGAVIGALDKGDKRRWHRDERGNRYWVDKRGRRHYGN